MIQTALARLNLKYKTIAFTTCTCYATYAPLYTASLDVSTYPEFCTHHSTPKANCGELLLNKHPSGKHFPKKTFIYHDFNDYLANLLSQQVIETLMDQSCDNLFTSLSSSPYVIKHPFKAQFLCEFCGPILNKLFIDGGNEEWFAFALHVESTFLSSLSARKHVSCWHHSWSVENLNHYIHPLINYLIVS